MQREPELNRLAGSPPAKAGATMHAHANARELSACLVDPKSTLCIGSEPVNREPVPIWGSWGARPPVIAQNWPWFTRREPVNRILNRLALLARRPRAPRRGCASHRPSGRCGAGSTTTSRQRMRIGAGSTKVPAQRFARSLRGCQRICWRNGVEPWRGGGTTGPISEPSAHRPSTCRRAASLRVSELPGQPCACSVLAQPPMYRDEIGAR
jgi:hypothetical protein